MTRRSVVTDSSDEDQIKLAERAEDDDRKDLEVLLKTKTGRRFLHQMIHSICHIDMPSRVPGDPEATAFNEGARAIGLVIKSQCEDHPSLYIKMLLENHFYDGADPKQPAPNTDT